MGNFTEQVESTESPLPSPTSPASPAGPACSLFPDRQELIIRKTFPTPDSDALLGNSPVCFEERVWQSKYLQKQLWSDAKSYFCPTREVWNKKGFLRGGTTLPSGGDWSKLWLALSWGRSYHSLPGPFPQTTWMILFNVEESIQKYTSLGPWERVFKYYCF